VVTSHHMHGHAGALGSFLPLLPSLLTHTNLSVPIPIGLPVRFRLQSFVLLGSLAAIAFLQCSLQRTIIDNLYVAVIFLIDILVRCLYTGTIVVVGCLF
jgi:VIT1/CCC1 family predicted Fe2+/Mn2+ transporter